MSARESGLSKYQEKKARVERAAFIVGLSSLTFLAVSRSNFSFDMPGFKNGVPNGYVTIFAPGVIFILAVWFYSLLTDCIDFRDKLLSAIASTKLGDPSSPSELESSLLKPPFYASERFGSSQIVSSQNAIAPHIPVFVAIACTFFLITEYLNMSITAAKESWPWDIVFGVGTEADGGWLWPFEGFKAHWQRSDFGSSPYVYPPLNTFAYLGVLIGLVYLQMQTWFNYQQLDDREAYLESAIFTKPKTWILVSIVVSLCLLLVVSMLT